MNIEELDSYNLADAIKFNNQLNPILWDKNEHLKDTVREKLLQIADEFREFLGVNDLQLTDITLSGSNAAYTYTPNSDIDLHLVVKMPDNEVYRELFDAKKYAFNEQHNIKIGGADVELYVQDSGQPHISQGIYSILNNKWLQVPRRIKSVVDDTSTRQKFETVGHQIEQAIKSSNVKKITRMIDKLKRMRQTGLENHGEFGPENLAFKMLRTQGKIKELYDARNRAKDQELSLKEKASPTRITYGFRTPRVVEDVSMSPDGVSPSTKMFLSETGTDEEILKDFIDFCVNELKIKTMPTIKLRKDPEWSVRNKTFGRYIDDSRTLEVAFGQRHIMDVLRTVAHELTHKHQHERDGNRMGTDAGETGSPWENEANARAGVLMRDYGRLHPELFDAGQSDLGESASGYIPTKKQARDPRWSMALTQDIKPGQLGKEANKLNLKTNSQGQPQIANPNGLFEKLALELNQFKRRGTLVVEQQLDEVRMAPSNLMQWATSPEAQGIRAGFEAELIFRDTSSGDDSGDDYEPDYDADERCTSIQGIIEFFQNGDYGGLSSRQENTLQNGLDEQYMEWFDEQMYRSWADERDELIREAWLRDKPMDERIHAALVDGLDLTDKQADAVVALHDRRVKKEVAGSELNDEQLEMASQYSEARSIADDILDEDVEQTIAKEDGFYDEVLDEFRGDFYIDNDREFFDDVGLRYMSDVANSYDLEWPYMTNSGSDNGGSRDWDSIGDSLHDTIDMPVKVSSGYHSATRKEGLWIVEPDSSLEPDDREDYGLEVVSPPMPLLVALNKLQEVTDWANDTSEGNAYTNSSTGLHMGVSVPFKGGDVDYLKLILFLGDEYVLQSFGREANTYTASAMKKLKQNIGNSNPRYAANVTNAMELMRGNLIELANREIQKGVGESKYTSVHIQKGYIEFRSAGGDWLAEESADPEKLQNTMLRYARAMSLAANPAAERREYAKKLYKLIAPEGDDQLALFSQYTAGELDKEQLKKRWSEKTLSKEAPKEVEKGEWVVVDNSTGKPVQGQSYNGYTKDEARFRAKQKLSPASSDRDFDLAYGVKPQNTGRWEIYSFDPNNESAEETLEIVDAPNRGAAADLVFDKYNDQKIAFKVRSYYGDTQSGSEKELSPRAKLAKRIAQPKSVDYNYEIVDKSTGQTVEKLYGKTRDDAYETFVNWARDRSREPFDFELRQIGQPQEAPADVAQNFTSQSTNPRPTVQEPNQVRMPNGVPVWEVYERAGGNVVHVVADHTQREAHQQAQTWLTGMGVEDPSLFAVRPKILQQGERNLSPTVSENFADGKGPGRPGDSQRHGIPKGATMAELEKASHAGGRKGQLARWQLNMRRGKKK